MRRNGFTLVEMLVVVGVIAVLAGLLFPALAHSRSAGLRTKCVNNHHQIIKAMGIYAGENDGQMIMRNFGKNNRSYTYATVLNGIYEGEGTHDYRTKSYVPKEVLVCPNSKEVLVTQHEKSSSDRKDYLGENAIGIISPVTNSYRRSSEEVNDTEGWLYKATKAHGESSNNIHYYYQSMGYFVNVPESEKEKGKKRTVTFVVDRMKNPAGLVIFADTYRKGGRGPSDHHDEFETFWAFNPQGENNTDCYVTLAHQNTCVTSLADGHVETMDPSRLRGCGTEIVKFLGSDLDKHPNSDGL